VLHSLRKIGLARGFEECSRHYLGSVEGWSNQCDMEMRIAAEAVGSKAGVAAAAELAASSNRRIRVAD